MNKNRFQTMLFIGALLASASSAFSAQVYTWADGTTTFTKADYADPTLEANQDRITDSVWLTRGDTRGLFNAAQESEYDYSYNTISPAGTEWADGSAAEWESLTFMTWKQWVDEWSGAGNVAGNDIDAVLHLIEEDIYIDIKFTNWTANEGGGFSYERAIVSGGVPPSGLAISDLVYTNGQINLSWAPIQSNPVRIEYKTNLTNTVWSAVSGATGLTGTTNHTFNLQSASDTCYYRVIAE